MLELEWSCIVCGCKVQKNSNFKIAGQIIFEAANKYIEFNERVGGGGGECRSHFWVRDEKVRFFAINTEFFLFRLCLLRDFYGSELHT